VETTRKKGKARERELFSDLFICNSLLYSPFFLNILDPRRSYDSNEMRKEDEEEERKKGHTLYLYNNRLT
jgi:hypothetical protein